MSENDSARTIKQLTDPKALRALAHPTRLALVGLLIGCAAWALGAHAQNYHQAFNGRRTVLVSGLAALLIGAAPALVNFFFHAGQGVH